MGLQSRLEKEIDAIENDDSLTNSEKAEKAVVYFANFTNQETVKMDVANIIQTLMSQLIIQ